MSSRPELRLDWCSHEAARYACEKWHYSKSLPAFKLVKIGCWESGIFKGALIFSLGVCPVAGNQFGISRWEVAELTRVALRQHETPVSRICSIAIKMIKRQSPGLRLLVSYADSGQGHHGGIYQAGGWVYVGVPGQEREYFVRGKWVHQRQASSLLGSRAGVKSRLASLKHKYLMPLDAEMRARILPLAKPYPKRATSIDADATANHAGEGGSIPTVALSKVGERLSGMGLEPGVEK